MCGASCAQVLTRPARSFLDAVGPEYLGYVAADAALDEREKRIRAQHVGSFRLAVDAAEALE